MVPTSTKPQNNGSAGASFRLGLQGDGPPAVKSALWGLTPQHLEEPGCTFRSVCESCRPGCCS